jgi:hypothetical protein
MGRKQQRIVILPSANKKKSVNWNILWMKLRVVYEAAGMDRHKAVLDNFRDQKEEICRVLNVVSEADLARIQRQLTEQVNQTKGI